MTALAAAPSAGYAYGALEVVGLPTDAATRKGLVLGYRVIGTVRILPSVKKDAITVGKAKASKGAAVLPIKNAGNTIDPVTGTVSVKGATGTRNFGLQNLKILPGKTVNLAIGTKLTKGSYSAKVSLKQAGKTAVSTTQKFTVK